MKRRVLSLLLSSLLLASCGENSPISSSSEDLGPYYKEVEEFHIHFDALFAQQESTYYCYFYGIACNACSSIREQATTLAKKDTLAFYFVYPGDEWNYAESPEEADASLGATSIEGVSIYSTPTLIEITDHRVTSYSRDYQTIKDFIEARL